MGRPRTPVGGWGTISFMPRSGGVQARARMRGPDGKMRLVSAQGASKAKARNALITRMTDMAAAATATGSGGITPSVTVDELCGLWLDRHADDVTPQTLAVYRSMIRGVIHERIGALQLREMTAGRVAAFLDGLTPGVAHQCRTVLVQAMRLAVAHDALAVNPVEQLPKRRAARGEVRALSIEELVELRAGVRRWVDGEIDDDGNVLTEPSGSRAWGLWWFLDLLLATGCRPGELAAARWCDVDLDGAVPRLLVCGTMQTVTGRGLYRQSWTKTRKERWLTLPPFAVRTLAEMQAERIDREPEAPLFPSASGTHRDPRNINKQWRMARRAAGGNDPGRWEWVDFRVMRRTVATVIDRAASDEEAAAQLGHAGTAVTRRHYIATRASEAPDLSSILEGLAG